MKPTPEQEAIVASKAEVLKIKAGAGTGKTTTLRALAAHYPRERTLYLAFNKAIKEEAQRKFPSHVRAMTAHGLAYANVGKYYGNTPNKLSHGDLKPFHVMAQLEKSVKKMPGGLHMLYAGRVLETIKNFLVSGDPDLAREHIALGGSPGEKAHFNPDQLLIDSVYVWECMQDLESPVPMTHDGYLKLFQLEMPDLGYDIVLLDEAQDTNPVTQALVGSQPSRLIYVGDEHQAIYGFRGASNAMALVDADEEFFLSGSFRFGKAVADVANALLEAKGETELRIRGLGGPSVLGELPRNQPFAFISRGNSSLFRRAVDALKAYESFGFVGPLTNYRFDLIEQTYRLMAGKGPINDPFLKAFESFQALEEYGEMMGDREIQSRCKLVTTYEHRIPSLVMQIQSQAQTFPGDRKVDVVLSSAHRSKGLEFDNVHLADDFLDFFDEEKGEWKNFVVDPNDPATLENADKLEEVNLQYVAATRAKKVLCVGQKLMDFLNHHNKVAARGPEVPEKPVPQEKLPPKSKKTSRLRQLQTGTAPAGRGRPSFPAPTPSANAPAGGRPRKVATGVKPAAEPVPAPKPKATKLPVRPQRPVVGGKIEPAPAKPVGRPVPAAKAPAAPAARQPRRGAERI